MAKDNLPAWQWVLLTVLQSVPKVKDGHDAWNKLNEAEQSAVMDFLGEHCGHDADKTIAVREETCGLIKCGKKRDWVKALVFFVIWMVVGLGVWYWVEQLVGDINWALLALTALLHMATEWRANPAGRMQQIWKAHEGNRRGTADALKEMLRVYNLPRKAQVNWFWLIAWAALLVLVLGTEIAVRRQQREPDLPCQVIRVIEQVAEGDADMTEAVALFDDVMEHGEAVEIVRRVWDDAAKWSDERYLTAALAVRLNLADAPEYAREALLHTRLTAIDTPAEAAEFAALLTLCDEETLWAVQTRLDAVDFPQKSVLQAALNAALE